MANYDDANPLVRILPCKGDRGVNTGATVVTSAADMKDKTKAYLYAGSESGYTNGDWYYYNGSAWVSGGEYKLSVVDDALDEDSENAVQNKVLKAALDGLIDDTLRVSSKAADAKVVGDRFNKVDGFVRKTDVLYGQTPTKLERGVTFTPTEDGGIAISGAGSESSFYAFYSSTTALPDWMHVGDKFYVDYSSDNVPFQVYFYDSSQNYINNGSVSARTSQFVTVPSNASGVIIRLFVSANTSVNETVYPAMRFEHYSGVDEQKTLRLLVYGNSFSYSTLGLLPEVFKEIAPDINLILGIAYKGGGTVKEHKDDYWEDNPYPCYSEFNGTLPNKWTNAEGITGKQAFDRQQWDYVAIQEHSSYNTQNDVKEFVDIIADYSNHTVSFLYNLTQAHGRGSSEITTLDDSDEHCRKKIEFAKSLLNGSQISYVLPGGTAVQNARHTSLSALGVSGDLCYDVYSHLQNGLPCLIPAYANAYKLCEIIGVKPKIFCGQFSPSDAYLDRVNYFVRYENAQNDGHGQCVESTDANKILAQKCALLAVKSPFDISAPDDGIRDQVSIDSETVGTYLPIPVKMASGFYIKCDYDAGTTIDDSNYTASDIYECAFIDCDPGDVFIINALSLGAPSVAVLDEDKKLIIRSQNQTLWDDTRLVIPEDGKYLIINNLVNPSDDMHRVSYKDKQYAYCEEITGYNFNEGYYVKYTDGNPVSYASRRATGYIQVKPNATYSVSFAYISGLAGVCEYGASRTFIQAAAYDTDPSGAQKKTCGLVFTTSDQTHFIRVSGYSGITPQVCRIRTVESNSKEIDEITPVWTRYTSPSANPTLIQNTASGGLTVAISGYDANTEITSCGKNIYNVPQTRTAAERNGVTVYYDSTAKSVRLVSSGATANMVSGTSQTINGHSIDCDFKFRFSSSRRITISGNCPDALTYYKYNKEFPVRLQICDGSTAETISGPSTSFIAAAGTEYGVRFLVLSGWEGDLTFYPQIEIGSKQTPFEKYQGTTVTPGNRSELRTYEGTTVVYTNDDTTLTATAYLMNDGDKERRSLTAIDNLEKINANFGASESPYIKLNKIVPMVCFIDDDTHSTAYVEEYRSCFLDGNDNLMGVGNYAVMAHNFELRTPPAGTDDRDNSQLISTLLNYEKEGFGMLYHCYHQEGATSTSPGHAYLPEYRDLAAAEDDFVTGLRELQTNGFGNYKYWVAPYGVNDEEMQSMAKRHGLRCLLSMGQRSYVVPCNANRWNIPRYAFNSGDADNTDFLKSQLLRCIEAKGLMIITSHVNAWHSSSSDASAKAAQFKALVTYCHNRNDVRIVSFPEAFETFYPIFLLNELF